MVECLTRDRGAAGLSITGITAMCPNIALVSERLLMGRKESNQTKNHLCALVAYIDGKGLRPRPDSYLHQSDQLSFVAEHAVLSVFGSNSKDRISLQIIVLKFIFEINDAFICVFTMQSDLCLFCMSDIKKLISEHFSNIFQGFRYRYVRDGSHAIR